MSEDSTTKGKNKSEGENGGPTKKKQKRAVRNENPNSCWTLQEKEDFKTFWDAPGRDKPNRVCLKFWILNECVEGCKKAKSHHTLTEDQKKDMNSFMKMYRKEN